MTVTYKGKEIGLLWGLGAIEIFQERMNCGLDGLDMVFTPNKQRDKATATLVHSAIICYAETNDLPVPMNYRQVQNLISELSPEEGQAIISDFFASKYYGSTWAELLGGDTADTNAGSEQKKSD